jgi:hypothetical protein
MHTFPKRNLLYPPMPRLNTNKDNRCCELARLHIGQSDYQKAVLAAITGLNVQQHFYDDGETVLVKKGLEAELGKCHVLDPSLGHHTTGANSLYPLS